MKTTCFKFATGLLILSALVCSCHTEPPQEEFPKNISFVEYSLEGTSCQWANLPYDETVIIINSNQELEKYISCVEDHYPVIDFSNNSLLIVSGKASNEFYDIRVNDFKQFSDDKNRLSIEILLDYKPIETKWFKALVVEKWNKGNLINLKVTQIDAKIIRPIFEPNLPEEIWMFFRKSFPIGSPPSSCFFQKIPQEQDTCIIINSMDELHQVYNCESWLPEIDFESYTLIIGKKLLENENSYFVEMKVIETDVLKLLICIWDHNHYPPNIFPPEVRGHWGLYPKLPKKTFNIEYINFENWN